MVLVSIAVGLLFPKHTGGLWPILSHKKFNHYLDIPSFKMTTIKHAQQFIQCDDYTLSIDLNDAYLHSPIVKHHYNFLQFVWPLGFSQSSLNLSCSFAIVIVSLLLSIQMISSSWFTLSQQARGHIHFVFLTGSPGLHINFSKSDLHLTQTFVSFLGYVGILSICQYLCFLIS